MNTMAAKIGTLSKSEGMPSGLANTPISINELPVSIRMLALVDGFMPVYLPRFAAIVTSNRRRIHVCFRFFIIPLLIRSLPDFFLPALATPKRLVAVKLRQGPIGVDVAQSRLVSGERGWVFS